jgi:hypothetical protein
MISIQVMARMNLRRSNKINSNRNIIDLQLLSYIIIDTMDENCVKSISIDRTYGIFNVFIVIGFQRLKLTK